MDCASLALQVAPVSYYCLNFFIGLRPKLGNTYYHITIFLNFEKNGMHPVGQPIYIFYMHQILVLFATCIKMANLIFVPLVMADIVILFVLNVFWFFLFLELHGR